MSELHAAQETRGSKCVSIWKKQSGGLFRSECSIAPYRMKLYLTELSLAGAQLVIPTLLGHQGVVVAPLNNAAVLQHHNRV